MEIFSRDSRIRLNLMDMQAKKGAGDDAGRRGELAKILVDQPAKLAEWCALAGIEKWGISTQRFAEELARCAAEARFRDEQPSVEELHAYVGALRLADLGLACACADGVAEAWEHFVGIYRGYLRACAGAMLKRSGGAAEAEELADSLFAELYGLSAERRGSLLRYFHGRSSLKTWLRAVLAQRHVDKIRAGRKFEELGDEDRGDGTQRPVAAGVLQAAADPHRVKYLLKFTEALQTALDNLDARDVERLRMYYAEEKKLAEIGRALEEHESSVSRHLEKVRREVRRAVEEILRGGSGAANGGDRSGGMSEAEIALCFEYAAENAPVDLDKLFSRGAARRGEIDGKEMREARRES
jgi:RNA polymerase sigma-70 factor (ECF subfamily)